MDVLDAHPHDGYCTIQHQQSDTNSDAETSLTSNPLSNDQLHQTESSQDDLQYASRAEDQAVIDCGGSLDQQQHHHHHHNQHQHNHHHHEQQQHNSQDCNFMATSEEERVGQCQRTCLFEAGNELSQDDVFVPFCAEAISTSDPNQKYYTNKLYKPLRNGANQVQQNQGQNYHQSNHQQNLESELHLEEQDDALSMYAELEFMESTIQKTVFNKILEDDDGDNETNLGKNHDDSLDNLQLTSLIDSFVEFADSPLGNNQNGDELVLPLYPPLSSNSAESPNSSQRSSVSGKPSLSNEHQMNELNFTSSDSYYQPPTNDHYLHQNLFGSQNYVGQSGTCYRVGSSDVSSENHGEQHQLDGDVVISSQNYIESHDQNPNLIENNNEILSSSSTSPQATPTNNKLELINTTTIADNNSEKRRSSEDEMTTMRRQKLKKRRSIMSYAEKNKQQTLVSPLNENSKGDNELTNSRLEHIKELNDQLMNDEDDIDTISDNNSMRSESSRRNPIVNHYRRRTANARERIRMREINQAFEKLKKVVPIELVEQAALESGEISDQASAKGGRRKSSPSSSVQGDSVKLTKITTLRMAVSYIAKLTEILNQTSRSAPNTAGIAEFVSKVDANSDQQTEETSGKSRPSRSKSRKTISDYVKRRQKGEKIISDDGAAEKKVSETTISDEINKKVGQDKCQNQMILTNPVHFNHAIEQRNQRPQQQTAFISIPSQQKRQYLASYPNQQLLISQPLGNERLVTPVAVAILGIPTSNGTNTHVTSNPNELIGTQNIQLVGIQKASAQPIIDPNQQNRTYNLQVAQPQPQQVTLTLNDMNGLSVLRLADSQGQSQLMPIQFRTINSTTNQHQIMQPNCQQPQIITTNNGVNYALRPILSQLTTNNSAKVTGRQERLGFMTHFSAQSGPHQISLANETNITKLVANLATSIQPQNNHSQTQTSRTTSNASEDSRQRQAQQQQQLQQQQQQQQAQQQQQQQPVRTYRFHNYDGNMINSHLYGNNNTHNRLVHL